MRTSISTVAVVVAVVVAFGAVPAHGQWPAAPNGSFTTDVTDWANFAMAALNVYAPANASMTVDRANVVTAAYQEPIPTLAATGPLAPGVTGGESRAAITVAGLPPGAYRTAAPPTPVPQGAVCSFLDAATVSKITGLRITKVTNDGDSCVYVDPTAPLSPVVQGFGQALSKAFSGESPLRLNGAPNGVPAPQSGAGVIVRVPSGGGDLTKVSVHDYVQGILAQVPPEAGCGPLQDVSGLNAASVVCLGGAIGHGGVVKDDKAIQIMYLASGNATNDVMGALLAAAAANM